MTLFLFVLQLASIAQNYNYLVIVVDDLRSFDNSTLNPITPNMDSLAAYGVTFKNAHIQQALCSPSRTSILTGIRPDSSKVEDFHLDFRDTHPDLVTLPQYFKNKGFLTASLGKVYHRDVVDSISWSEKPWNPSFNNKLYALQENKSFYSKNKTGPVMEFANVSDAAYLDGVVTIKTLDVLDTIKSTNFFMCVGFYKPHLPFAAPKQYWDMYDHENISAQLTQAPTFSHESAVLGTGELYGWQDVRTLDQQYSDSLAHAYMACVSYVDAQIGKIMKKLKDKNLHENTVVIVLSDHGYKLGEFNAWGKRTYFDYDTKIPLIISHPEFGNRAIHTTVEALDIYPTILDFENENVDGLQGESLVDLMKGNESERRKNFAITESFISDDLRAFSILLENDRYTIWVCSDSKVIFEEWYPNQDYAISQIASINLELRQKLLKLIDQNTSLNLEDYLVLGEFTDVASDDFILYPNPTSDFITIKTTDLDLNFPITLYNISGVEILTQQIAKGETKIDISKLTSGSYIVQFTNRMCNTIRKIIIKI